MGTITLSNTVAALAPGKFAETWTVGGAISGYWVVGSAEIPRTPNINMIMETTLARTGRSINFLIMGSFYLNTLFNPLAMLSNSTGWAIIGVWSRSVPTPLATILSPGAMPLSTTIILPTLSRTFMARVVAKVSPCTL